MLIMILFAIVYTLFFAVVYNYRKLTASLIDLLAPLCSDENVDQYGEYLSRGDGLRMQAQSYVLDYQAITIGTSVMIYLGYMESVNTFALSVGTRTILYIQWNNF